MRVFFATLRISLILAVVLRVGTAHALSFEAISEAEVKATLTRMLAAAKASSPSDYNAYASLVTRAVGVSPVAELTALGCPMAIRVINGTNKAFFQRQDCDDRATG